MTAPRIEVHADDRELVTAVAGELLARLSDAQEAGRTPHVVLTGGSIAETLHREIARLGATSEVDWSRVVVWWGDERFVAPDSADRNAVDTRKVWLDAIGVPAAHVHEMPSTAQAADVDAAARAYAEELAASGPEVFDVVMLGLGPDAHVASLFPGHPALDVTDRTVAGVTGSPKPPPERITLTFPTLNRAASVWFLVSGEGKAEAVSRAVTENPETPVDLHDVPAAGVVGREKTIWFLDRAAASLL